MDKGRINQAEAQHGKYRVTGHGGPMKRLEARYIGIY